MNPTGFLEHKQRVIPTCSPTMYVTTSPVASPVNEVRQKANFEYHQRAEMVIITDADLCHTLRAATLCYCINKNPPLE